MNPPRDARLSFDEVVEAYDSSRPSYPAALFDRFFDGLPPEPEIIEVGPGTGQATAALLQRGASVHAIELGPAMARKLRSNLPSRRLRLTVGQFEDVELVAASADAIFSATAYHWIDLAAQTDRPATILRPGGVIAVVDLTQVDSPTDSGFFARAQPIYERYGQGHTGSPAPAPDTVDPPVRSTLKSDGRFDQISVSAYRWDQSYSAQQYRTLMASYSVTQMMEESQRIALLDDIEAFVNHEFGGSITRPLVVTLTTATRI